jgi:hypothetical protein
VIFRTIAAGDRFGYIGSDSSTVLPVLCGLLQPDHLSNLRALGNKLMQGQFIFASG